MDVNTRAARAFYHEVRKFSLRTKPWQTSLAYHTKAGYERHDLTLVSRMVYGRPDEFLAVMAAAGLDTADDVLTERLLILPNEAQLHAIKVRTGYESRPAFREPDGTPIWMTERMRGE